MSNAEKERDINDLFDDIVLTEERILQESYNEGVEIGHKEGNIDSYKLGYAQAIQFGEELGEIYGALQAWQLNKQHTDKVQRKITHLLEIVEKFPKVNASDKDILGDHKTILALYKSLQNMMGRRPNKENKEKNTQEVTEDFSF